MMEKEPNKREANGDLALFIHTAQEKEEEKKTNLIQFYARIFHDSNCLISTFLFSNHNLPYFQFYSSKISYR